MPAGVDWPPEELLTFRPGDWAEFVPAFDERVDTPQCNASEPLRVRLREAHVWMDARRAWTEQHGWPAGDSVDFIRDHVAVKLALLEDDYTAPPHQSRRW